LFRRRAILPISELQRLWVDEGLSRLDKLMGDAMLEVSVILPEDRYFPETFKPTLTGARVLANRVADYMRVSEDAFELHVYADGEDEWKETLPLWSGQTQDAGGLFFSKPDGTRFTVGVHANKLKDPFALVATLAHELAHVILLGGGLIERDEPLMEPLTDLATVVLGFGVFNSGAAYRFSQWTEGQMQGWSTERAGYLSEELWGYALARFAQIRSEAKPAWRDALVKNVQVYFDQSARWLKENAGA
jgi:hypothetical protein